MEKQAMGLNQKKAIIDKEITAIYSALVINSEKICSYMADSWAADLLTIVIEYFLRMDIDKQYQIVTTPSKKASSLEKYLTKCMALSVKSSTSPFYRTYRMRMYKHRELIPDFDYSKMIGNFNPDDEDKWGDRLENIHSEKDTHYYHSLYNYFIRIRTKISHPPKVRLAIGGMAYGIAKSVTHTKVTKKRDWNIIFYMDKDISSM